MVDELIADWHAGRIVLDARLNERGKTIYIGVLDRVFRTGTDAMLAQQLRGERLLVTEEPGRTKNGRDIRKRIPSNAADVLAEWDFNTYYIRAICVRALSLGMTHVEVYRAKSVAEPRPDSERKIGTLVDARALLEDRRRNLAEAGELGVPAGPGSGLCVRLTARR